MTVSELPEPTKTPCVECPWRRTSEPGYLGPHSAEEWIFFAHSGGPIGCHKTISVDEDWSQPGLRQCAGAATLRANDGIAANRAGVSIGPVDTAAVFSDCSEFLEHHRAPDEGTQETPRTAAEFSRWADDLGSARIMFREQPRRTS